MSAVTKWESEQAARRMIAAQLIATHPHLVPVSDKVNSLVAAAKNIRIELAQAFPGVKFAVRSSRYSGGDSIDVSWQDGPTSSQVDAILGQYEAGSFDGMTDSYDYRGDHGWTDAFGDAKYIHGSRSYSDRMLTSVMGRIAHKFGFATPSIEDYRRGRVWALRAGNCEPSHEINAALSRHTYCK